MPLAASVLLQVMGRRAGVAFAFGMMVGLEGGLGSSCVVALSRRQTFSVSRDELDGSGAGVCEETGGLAVDQSRNTTTVYCYSEAIIRDR